jgi:hypothetical protein
MNEYIADSSRHVGEGQEKLGPVANPAVWALVAENPFNLIQ